MGIVFDTLETIGMTSEESREVFSKKTRDFENLVVYRDKVSGVIYIDDYITGNDIYRNINYTKSRPDYERDNDSARRLRDFKNY